MKTERELTEYDEIQPLGTVWDGRLPVGLGHSDGRRSWACLGPDQSLCLVRSAGEQQLSKLTFDSHTRFLLP